MIILSTEVIAGEFIGHDGRNPENYEDQHGGYDYGVRNKEKDSWILCSYKHDSREYTLQEKDESPSHL